MKFLGFEKINEGRFITRYDLMYETEQNNVKKYEMISREKNIKGIEDLRRGKPDAVIIIAHSSDGNSILLNKEFRMAVGESVYNFPAGLIDPGEDCKTAAKRELWEETGLNLYSIDSIMPESYSAVGFSNETSVVLIGKADGDFSPSTSDLEEIEAGWFTKEDVKALLQTEAFAARTQAYCWMWANS